MNTTILFGQQNQISHTSAKVINLILGGMFILFGSLRLINQGFSFESSGQVFLGTMFFLILIVYYTPTSISPRIQIDDKEIVIRTRIFGSTTRLNWVHVQTIQFKSYELIFQLKNEIKTISYKCNPEISLQAKQALREMAMAKNIEVTDG